MAAGQRDNDVTREDVANLLDRIADLLEMEGSNPFRTRAYRDGAQTIRNTDAPILRWARENERKKLEDLPDIGSGLTNVIVEYVQTGHSSQLADLLAAHSPEQLLTQVAGIGEELAARVHDELGVNTLEELEQAAHDGRLEDVEGFGPRRVQMVRDILAGRLSRSAQRHSRQAGEETQEQPDRPPVRLLLELDEEYRRKAAAGELPTIAPRRFNPDEKAWLPLMHASREGWDFTLLFSNTAQAHELEKTHDWVVIYYRQNGEEAQNTIVTETSGQLEGNRVVRGRERETQEYYATS